MAFNPQILHEAILARDALVIVAELGELATEFPKLHSVVSTYNMHAAREHWDRFVDKKGQPISAGYLIQVAKNTKTKEVTFTDMDFYDDDGALTFDAAKAEPRQRFREGSTQLAREKLNRNEKRVFDQLLLTPRATDLQLAFSTGLHRHTVAKASRVIRAKLFELLNSEDETVFDESLDTSHPQRIIHCDEGYRFQHGLRSQTWTIKQPDMIAFELLAEGLSRRTIRYQFAKADHARRVMLNERYLCKPTISPTRVLNVSPTVSGSTMTANLN